MDKIKLNNNQISDNNRCFIIGEAGINHDGSIQKAKELVDVAIDAGVDAVKFQMFDTPKYISKDAIFASYMKRALLRKDETIAEFFRRLEVRKKDMVEIQKYCKKRKILFLCTPFDIQNVNFLNRINVPIIKVASFSLTNIFLLESIARLKKPVIMSTGLHNLSEIENAYNILKKSNKPVKIDELQKKVWEYNSDLETHTVETHIYRIRKKIQETFKINNFISNTDDGYKLNL